MKDSFTTTHKVLYNDSRDMSGIEPNTVNLIITSPPYPMIKMWDDVFNSMNIDIGNELNIGKGERAFELMHQELDRVWDECFRVLKNGGIMCINVGDATRTIKNNFQLYSNHSRILSYCLKKGFHNLPNIIWRKTTNAPNKYMGSGMLPVGAYVTLEHEYILIFRKGLKREFKSQLEKSQRRKSAFFWEERNQWFSDIWFNLTGANQNLNNKELRERSGAFPFELAHRLINMFSVYGDSVLDPFLGTGTTTIASIVNGRNSYGFEIDHNFQTVIESWIIHSINLSKALLKNRITQHLNFINEREKEKEVKYYNSNYSFKCVSSQEKDLVFHQLLKITELDDNSFSSVLKELLEEQMEEMLHQKIKHNIKNTQQKLKNNRNQLNLI